MPHRKTIKRAVPADYGKIEPLSGNGYVDHTPTSVLINRNYATQMLYPAGLSGQDIDFVIPGDLNAAEFDYETPPVFKPKLWQRSKPGLKPLEICMNGHCPTPKDGPRQRIEAHDGPMGLGSEPFRRGVAKRAWVTSKFPNAAAAIERYYAPKPPKVRKPKGDRKPSKPKTPPVDKSALAKAVSAEIKARKAVASAQSDLNKLSCGDSAEWREKSATLKSRFSSALEAHYAAQKLVASLQ